MKKTFLFAIPLAMAALATGCSQDSTADAPLAPDAQKGAIRFVPNTAYTRSGDLTSSNLNSFNVYAFTEEEQGNHVMFMDDVAVSRTENNIWTYSPLEFWPSKPVDFYAYAPAGKWAGLPNSASNEYMNYPGDTDLIYAVSLGNRGSAQGENAQVILNFRHALSKVAVKLSSSNADLDVKVTNVVIANLYAKGTFNYPKGATTATSEPSPASVCTWTGLSTNTSYIYMMSQTADDRVSLTTTPTDMSAESPNFGGAKYIIPQTLPYDEGADQRDVYLTVMCSIYDKQTGVKLWPNDNTPAENRVPGSTFDDGLLKFPVKTSQFTSWEPGKYYIYNVVINANPDMGHIEFGMPTVENYVTVESNFE